MVGYSASSSRLRWRSVGDDEEGAAENASLKAKNGTTKHPVLSKFMQVVVNKKRLLNVFRSASFYTQASATTAATESSEHANESLSTAASLQVGEQHHDISTPGGDDDDDEHCKCEGDRRGVLRFAANDVVRITISRHDYTDAELEASWFQEDEYTEITMQCCKQVRKMEKGKVFKDKKYCSRGLESLTRQAAMDKAYSRRLAFDAVLDEQDEQWQLGVVDEEAIAERYAEVSSSCQLWASVIGLRDQREAETYADD